MLRYPAGEHITVPRHVETERVRTLLTASTIISLPLVSRVAPLAMVPFQLSMRTPLRRALGTLIARLPEGPSEESRRSSSFTIVCEARRDRRKRRGTVTGGDVYGLTARTTVEGALRCAARGTTAQGPWHPRRRSIRGIGMEKAAIDEIVALDAGERERVVVLGEAAHALGIGQQRQGFALPTRSMPGPLQAAPPGRHG